MRPKYGEGYGGNVIGESKDHARWPGWAGAATTRPSKGAALVVQGVEERS